MVPVAVNGSFQSQPVPAPRAFFRLSLSALSILLTAAGVLSSALQLVRLRFRFRALTAHRQGHRATHFKNSKIQKTKHPENRKPHKKKKKKKKPKELVLSFSRSLLSAFRSPSNSKFLKLYKY
jgi:hypothetical protein